MGEVPFASRLLTPGRAERVTKLGVREQPLDGSAEIDAIHEQPGHPVVDCIDETPDSSQ